MNEYFLNDSLSCVWFVCNLFVLYISQDYIWIDLCCSVSDIMAIRKSVLFVFFSLAKIVFFVVVNLKPYGIVFVLMSRYSCIIYMCISSSKELHVFLCGKMFRIFSVQHWTIRQRSMITIILFIIIIIR